jgi:predicted acyl esterase
VLLVAGAMLPTPAVRADGPGGGESVAFAPPAMPAPRYGIVPPSANPAQVRVLTAGDGTPIYTETWLPGALDGAAPPERVPVVVQYTPYAVPGGPDDPTVIDLLVPRGYAVTFAHVRGSGGSGGCLGLVDQHEVDDGALVIEDAGERAPWASGAVGMVGGSYPGGTQLAVATGPDRDRLESLRAIVPLAPASSLYDVLHHDGVPHFLSGPGQVAVYLAALTNPTANPTALPERPGCTPDLLAGVAVPSGDYSAFFEERDHPRNLDRLEAATLMIHGNADRRVTPLTQAGLFDRIPASTPRAGMFGVWGHEVPVGRPDYEAMVVAWFERHLRGIDNGVDDWPVVQVQGTDGRWRTATDWPSAPGPERSLLLGPGGELDATAPTGSTTYLEAPSPELEADGIPSAAPGTAAIFTTPALPAAVELVGTITLDAWVVLAAPDAHLTARLEVVDAEGRRLTPESRTVGARSARHLDPIVDGRFTQREGTAPPTGEPVRVTLRFDPVDLVAPAGSHLRLTVAGSSIVFDGLDGLAEGLGVVFQGPTWPSMTVQPVTILHDPTHPSALRFRTREPGSVLLEIGDTA